MFDTSVIWANVLKKLRENNEIVLMTVCSDLSDIEFTNDNIIINTNNETTYSMLNKYLKTLNNYAGGDIININLYKKQKANTQYIEKLTKMFGKKIKVEVN